MNQSQTYFGQKNWQSRLDVGTLPLAYQAQREFANFLDRFPWTHFGTFTTRSDLGIKGARRLAEKIAKKIKTVMVGSRLKMFWVAEAFAVREEYHLHCLIYSPRKGQITALEGWYENSHGFCKILEKKGKASMYVTKHIHRPQNDWGII